MSSKKIVFFSNVRECSFYSSLLHCSSVLKSFDCFFLDLSDKVNFWLQMKRISTVLQIERPDVCYLVLSSEKNITLYDYGAKMMLKKLGIPIVIFCPEGRKDTFMGRVLRKSFFNNQQIVIADWRDYQMLCRYTSKEKIIVCPSVDNNNFTLSMFEDRMMNILKQS